MSQQISYSDLDILNEDQGTSVEFQQFSANFKFDLEIETCDYQASYVEAYDLDQKINGLKIRMNCLKERVCHTPQRINDSSTNTASKSFKRPIQPIQHQSMVSCEVSSPRHSEYHVGEIKLIGESESPKKRSSRNLNLSCNQRPSKMPNTVSPSLHRYESRKRSHFSQQMGSDLQAALDPVVPSPIPHKRAQIGLSKTQNRSDLAILRKIRHKASEDFTCKLEQRDGNQKSPLKKDREQSGKISKRDSRDSIQNLNSNRVSMSSIDTIKSILKSSKGSSMLDLSFVHSVQSRQSFQSLNVAICSPEKRQQPQEKKKVRFSLSRKQARREQIEC